MPKVRRYCIMHFMQLVVEPGSQEGTMSTKNKPQTNAGAKRASPGSDNTGAQVAQEESSRPPRKAVARKRRQYGRTMAGLRSPAGGRPGNEITDNSIRGVFYGRVTEWARNLAETAPTEVLAEALSRVSARSTIVHVLDQIPAEAEKSEEEILREKALERGVLLQDRLRREAGGLQPTQWVADHLGVTRQTIDRYRKEGALLALDTAHGFMFPVCQFHEGRVIPGLREVLAGLQDGNFWETLSALVTPVPSLRGRSIIEALQAAKTPEDRARIVAVVRAYTGE